MHEIFNSIEEDNFTLFQSIIANDPQALEAVDDDNWGIFSLLTQYQMPEYIDYLLKVMTAEQINAQNPHPLTLALENSDHKTLALLLRDEKINAEITTKSGDSLLHAATALQDASSVALLLERGLSPLQVNNVGQSAVSMAIYKNYEEIFTLFEQAPELYSGYDETWIKYAIQTGNATVFEHLYPHSKLTSDELFQLAYEFSQVKVAAYIVESGDFLPGTSQITEIVELMSQHYEQSDDKKASVVLADYLFEIQTPFHKFVNNQGQSAWMLAIQNDNEDVFKRLVESEETVNTCDAEKHTPLFYAIEKNNCDFVKLLLKKKANVNQTDRNKDTPLIKAVKKGNKDLVNAILEYPVFINEINNNNENALSLAIRYKRMDMVGSIIWAGGEISTNPANFVEEKDVFHFNAAGSYEKLLSYTEENQVNNFIALSKLGFKLDQKNEIGDTFLLHFIKNGYVSNFNALLKCSLNANQQDIDGNSAIMCAMMKNSDHYALALLNKFNNIDLSITNKDGASVYDLACKSGKVERLQALVRYDDDISKVNLTKSLPIIAKEGQIETVAARLPQNITKITDTYDNNLLMLAVVGSNMANFEYLLSLPNVKFDITQQNKNGKNVVDLISAMPEESAKDFNYILTDYLSASKKKP